MMDYDFSTGFSICNSCDFNKRPPYLPSFLSISACDVVYIHSLFVRYGIKTCFSAFSAEKYFFPIPVSTATMNFYTQIGGNMMQDDAKLRIME